MEGEGTGEENGDRYCEEQDVVLPLEPPPGPTEETRCQLIETPTRGLFVPH